MAASWALSLLLLPSNVGGERRNGGGIRRQMAMSVNVMLFTPRRRRARVIFSGIISVLRRKAELTLGEASFGRTSYIGPKALRVPRVSADEGSGGSRPEFRVRALHTGVVKKQAGIIRFPGINGMAVCHRL